MRRVEFLGHIVSDEGVEPQWSKVEAINALKRPTSVTEVRAFLGMATYYCRFLDHYSHVKKPLTSLTRKDVVFTWGEEQEAAFDAIKKMLTSAPVLRNPDWTRPFVLHTDWSKAGVGACLSQVDGDGHEYAVAYASRMNSTAESNFCSYEGEVSAVVYAVQRFRYYLWGAKFQLITDCKAMTWMTTTARLRSKVARWSLILAEYDFDIQHRPGVENTVPDLLSRQPGQPVAADHGIAFYASARQGVGATLLSSAMHGQWAAPMLMGVNHAVMEAATRDVWTSPVAMQFIRGELQPQNFSAEQWSTLKRKCAPYVWQNGKLWRYVAKHGMQLEVPPPEERQRIVREQHVRIGHLGRDRTHSILSRAYTWPGMFRSVADALRACSVCDRVRATFSMKYDRLQPLPIFGLFYRFHVDATGPLRASRAGYKYVIIIVEAFSKWIDLVPLRELTAKAVATVFNERVLARYGAPVEVVTDNGHEYEREFSKLLQTHGIDHRTTSANHPSANGMAERIVEVLKRALRKFVLQQGILSWDDHLPVVEFGYRVTTQSSTGYSPYFLLYGRHPVSPDTVRAQLHGVPLDVEDEEQVLQFITARAEAIRLAMPRAFERALAAQHRDTTRYQRVRRGELTPRSHRFRVGEFVYVVQKPLSTLDVRTTRTKLRVGRVLPTGVLVLEGADGQSIPMHMESCAPCHIPNLVTSHDGVSADLECEVCRSASMADPMLLCDKCCKGYHLSCLTPPLLEVPEGDWLCTQCSPHGLLGHSRLACYTSLCGGV
jgi:hypothetical protein